MQQLAHLDIDGVPMTLTFVVNSLLLSHFYVAFPGWCKPTRTVMHEDGITIIVLLLGLKLAQVSPAARS